MTGGEPATDTTATEPTPTVEDDIGATWDKLEGDEGAEDDQAGAPDGGGEATAAAADADEEQAAKAEADDEAAPGDTEDDEASDEAATADKDEGADDAAEGDDDSLEPPKHWKADDREAFATLDDTGKQTILAMSKRMEAAHMARTREVTEQQESLGRYAAFDEELEPYREQMALDGIDDVTAVRRLFAAQTYLIRDPAAAIQWLAKSYGVNLSTLSIEPDDSDLAEDYDNAELAGVKKDVSTLTAREVAREVAARQERLNDAGTQIETFQAAKDANGALLHPYAKEVLDDMGSLAAADRQAGKAPVLDDLYERACWANAEVRKKVLQDRDAAAAGDTATKRKKRLAEAKKTGTAVKSGSPGAPDPDAGGAPSDTSVDEDVGRVYDKLAGAV